MKNIVLRVDDKSERASSKILIKKNSKNFTSAAWLRWFSRAELLKGCQRKESPTNFWNPLLVLISGLVPKHITRFGRAATFKGVNTVTMDMEEVKSQTIYKTQWRSFMIQHKVLDATSTTGRRLLFKHKRVHFILSLSLIFSAVYLLFISTGPFFLSARKRSLCPHDGVGNYT